MHFSFRKFRNLVAPFAGAWIEIVMDGRVDRIEEVAPFAGAWIEILISIGTVAENGSRSLGGSVD